MNETLRNNAVLHLAKSFLASIVAAVLLIIFYGSMLTGHYILGIIILIMYAFISAISLIQMILFIKKMIKANKK